MISKIDSIAVCVSGGLDSAVLLGNCAQKARRVYPFFIKTGHPWESDERKSLSRFIKALARKNIDSIVDIELPVMNSLEEFWGKKKYHPGYNQGYRANYIPGRNLTLLSAALLPAFARKIEIIALGILKHNPYPDAQLKFLRLFEDAASSAFAWSFKFLTPLIHLEKEQVIMMGRHFPLHLTMSCAAPVKGQHCGDSCNKCAERQKAFFLAGMADPARYARRPPTINWKTHRWPD